jgi:CrcB protein
MKVVIQALAIGTGGFVGALTRWAVGSLFGSLLPTTFPVGTFFINISGSFFLGWFLTFVSVRYPVSDTLKLAVATGFVGAYTTFSTYMYESTRLNDEGAWIQSTMNLLGSLVVGLMAVKLGMILARRA